MAQPPRPPSNLRPRKIPKNRIENYENKNSCFIVGLVIGFFIGMAIFSLIFAP